LPGCGHLGVNGRSGRRHHPSIGGHGGAAGQQDNPVSGERVMTEKIVEDVLAILMMNGLYDESGRMISRQVS
jgi:hypothetical protein